MKGMTILFLVMLGSILIASLWNSIPAIKDSVHAVLDPTAGKLMNWNIYFGFIVVSLIITLITTLVQKYTTDQETLKKLKQEQKLLQEEMKKYKDNPEKMLEFQKKSFEIIPKTMDITMRPIIYTFVPFVLLLRWFGDYFAGNPFKFFGFLSWIWFYILSAIALSVIIRKVLKTE
ncbi:DUF106 domain-containing protein [archaeon]|nr:DUF106 domain-containing protein [archaeon]